MTDAKSTPAYTLKAIPEDFIVKEKATIHCSEGSYAICLLRKREFTTTKALELISRHCNIRPRDIGFCGNKDKTAVTEQFISLKNVPREKIESFSVVGITLTYVGQAPQPLHLGDHLANEFCITIRNHSKEIEKKEYFVNYFGEQRFSVSNVLIGKNLLQKKFKEATELIVQSNKSREIIHSYLQKNPTDFVGALLTMPHAVLSLYVGAYQSYVWNKMVSRLLDSSKTINISGQVLSIGDYNKEFDKEFPLIGFETEFNKYKWSIEAWLKEEGISQRDFIIPQLKSLSAGGGFRSIFAKVKDFSVKTQDDELSLGKKKYVLTFTLPKGCYATVYIQQLLS